MTPSTASVPGESSNRSLPLWHFAYSSSVSLLLVWPQQFLNSCLLCQVSEQVSLCTSPLRVIPSTQALLKVSPFGFQRQMLMGLIFLMQVPRAGVHDVGLELLLFRGDSAFMISPFCLWVAILGMGFPGGSEVKVSACNAGALGSTPGSRRSPGEENGNPLQYSSLETPMDEGAW